MKIFNIIMVIASIALCVAALILLGFAIAAGEVCSIIARSLVAINGGMLTCIYICRLKEDM